MLPYLISLWITVGLCLLLLIVIPIQCMISGSEIPELFEPEYIAELKANGRFRSFIVCVWIILAIVTGVCVCVWNILDGNTKCCCQLTTVYINLQMLCFYFSDRTVFSHGNSISVQINKSEFKRTVANCRIHSISRIRD